MDLWFQIYFICQRISKTDPFRGFKIWLYKNKPIEKEAWFRETLVIRNLVVQKKKRPIEKRFREASKDLGKPWVFEMWQCKNGQT